MNRLPEGDDVPAVSATDSLRLDRFLVFARFFRTRGRAQAVVAAGRIRINGQKTDKAHAGIRPGDVLTFPQGQRIRVVRVLALPQRRGPAAEMTRIYEEVPPPGDSEPGPPPEASVFEH